MKADYHVHLEEGPYSLSFVEKTLKALEHFEQPAASRHTADWLESSIGKMDKRLAMGEYSEWWLDFYLEEALRKGLKEVGIVDHLYRFKETKPYYEKYMDVTSKEIGSKQADWLNQVMVRQLDEFVAFIQSQKEKWASKGVQLKLGMEADFFAGGEEELQQILSQCEFDYVIGSVHFYRGWGFDNPELQHKFSDYVLVDLYKEHFETVKQAAESNLFDVIAHLDNVKAFNYRPDESALLNMYREVARALVKNDVATEINPGLYYRYPVKEMCPSHSFLDILSEEGAVFTTSSDSHFPNDIGIYADRIQTMLMEKKIYQIATFEKRQRIMKPIEHKVKQKNSL